MQEQIFLRRIRPLSKLWGVGHETLRKFANGETDELHPRQIRLYGTKFLELHPSGYVREKRVDGVPKALEQLKMVLPPGRENAQEVIDQIRAAVERDPGELSVRAPEVLEWLRKVLDAEYDAEGRYPPPKRPRPAPAVKDEEEEG